MLARVASLFSRRGFNIESLAVGPTEVPQVSRMTVVVNVEGSALEQVTKQLNKLINVLKIVELDPAASVQREILLVKVKADLETRSHILETVQLFRAKVVDVAPMPSPSRPPETAINWRRCCASLSHLASRSWLSPAPWQWHAGLSRSRTDRCARPTAPPRKRPNRYPLDQCSAIHTS